MSKYERIKRKVAVVVSGIRVFKDWPMWLGFRLGLLKRDSRERLFRTRRGEKYYFRADVCSGAGYFQEMYLQNNYFKTYSPKDGDVVVDIGAHIGIFSIMVAQSKQKLKILSYEPSPALYNFLRRNIRLNVLDKGIRAVPVGVGEKEGVVKFYASDLVSGTTAWEAAREVVHPQDYIMASVTTLEKIFETNQILHCDFLKMDCEGAEFEALLATPSEVFRKISHMAIEYHLPPAPLVTRLAQEGFVVQVGQVTSNNVGMLYADRELDEVHN